MSFFGDVIGGKAADKASQFNQGLLNRDALIAEQEAKAGYAVYTKYDLNTISDDRKENNQTLDLLKLIEPSNQKIPENFELLYKSDKTETVVYKINWDE